jgi:hypothetical protein
VGRGGWCAVSAESMGDVDLVAEVGELKKRVTGLEELLADLTQSGRFIAVSPPGPDDHHLSAAARRVEAELQEPAPDGRY